MDKTQYLELHWPVIIFASANKHEMAWIYYG